MVAVPVVLLLTMSTRSKAPDNGLSHIPESNYQIPDKFLHNLDEDIIKAKADQLNETFENLQKRNGFNGAVMYAEKGRLVYQKAFGQANVSDNSPLSIHTPFELASVSKMFTALAVMILKERNQLSFEDTITKFFPDFPYPGITIRNLLNHRSGLSRYMSLAHTKWPDKTKGMSNKDMLDLFIKHKPKTYYQPDQKFHYCNTNYALLACLVEEVSGMPFDRFVKMHIFRPLQMNDSFVYNMDEDSVVSFYLEEGATGYRFRGWRKYRVRNNYLNAVMGDKGVFSSVADMYKFDQALYDQLLVSKETLTEAFKKGSADDKKYGDDYGFGWRIKSDMDSCVYHYGWWKGFRSFFIRDIKNQKSIVVLSNFDKGPGSAHFWKIIKNNEHELGYISKLDVNPFFTESY